MGDPPCPQCKGKDPFGVEIRGVYDGILLWECRYCGHRWPRFPEGTGLHRRATEMIKMWEEARGRDQAD